MALIAIIGWSCYVLGIGFNGVKGVSIIVVALAALGLPISLGIAALQKPNACFKLDAARRSGALSCGRSFGPLYGALVERDGGHLLPSGGDPGHPRTRNSPATRGHLFHSGPCRRSHERRMAPRACTRLQSVRPGPAGGLALCERCDRAAYSHRVLCPRTHGDTQFDSGVDRLRSVHGRRAELRLSRRAPTPIVSGSC